MIILSYMGTFSEDENDQTYSVVVDAIKMKKMVLSLNPSYGAATRTSEGNNVYTNVNNRSVASLDKNSKLIGLLHTVCYYA